MNERDRQQRLYVATQAAKLRNGRISRRTFLRRAAEAGFALGAMSLTRGLTARASTPTIPTALPMQGNEDMVRWLRDVGRGFRGKTIRIASESTQPSRVISELAEKEFSDLTGIRVRWTQMPLDQVLEKITQDTARGSASNDIYYLDQSWLGRFVNDTVDPMTYMSNTGSDLNMPGYAFEDFLKPLVDYTASYQGRLVGLPYDIPVMIMMYRKDVFEKLKLKPPTTIVEYMEVVKTIHEAGLKNEDGTPIYGTVGQWQAGHYALQCDWTAWLWAHGGSHFGKDGKVAINDDAAAAGAEYMLNLSKYADPDSATYDWGGQLQSIAAGKAGIIITWSEVFATFDDPSASKIVGLLETAPLPKELALRPAADASFDENPGIAHQGGSALALSKYSRVQDAAWVFTQWATSSDVTTRASLLGGSASPVRQSNYDDARTLANNRVMVGTTRHFAATLESITTRMGTEPHYPGWADASATGGPIPTALGKMITRQEGVKASLDAIADAITKSL